MSVIVTPHPCGAHPMTPPGSRSPARAWNFGVDDGPGSLLARDNQATVHRRDPVRQAAQSRSALGVRSADTVVADLDHERAVVAADVDLRMARVRIAGHVGERLRDDEVSGRLDR